MKNDRLLYRVLAVIPLKHTVELLCEDTGKIFYFKLDRSESIRSVKVGQTVAINWTEVSTLSH